MKSFLSSILFLVFISSTLVGQKNTTSSWSKKFGYQQSFIENKGQFVIPNSFGNPSPVLFAVDHGGTKIYFTAKGITYAFLETSRKQKDTKEIEREREEEFKNPEEHARHEKEEHQLKVKADQVTMLWQNANPNAEILADEVTADYHSYYFKQSSGAYKNVSNIKGFKKITYKNIYPNIDIDYVFHKKGGLEYSLTLHPGADPSKVKMVYDSNVDLNNAGEIRISSKFGDIIDHAPLTFYLDNNASVIASSFTKIGKTVSFQLANYDKTKTVVIDPWTQTPAFTSNWDCVWECEKDGAGNVYMIGGVNPMQLLKYNSAGALQWTFNTPYDTTAWLGTMATDLAGSSYVSLGSIAKILKVNNTGSLAWANSGSSSPGASDEYWTIAFNCDQTKLIVGGTTYISTLKGVIFDIDISTGVPTHTQVVAMGSMMSSPPSIQEVRSITAGKNGKYYFLTHDTIGYISQNFSACTSGSTLFKTNSKYALDYKCENFRYNNSGIAAIKANQNFIYTQNGTHLHKRSLATGAILDTAVIPGGASINSAGRNQVRNSGIDIDDCGNVYVGSINAVIKFDANLNQLAAYPTSYIVYDLHVTSGGDIIVCGSTGNSSTPSRTGYIETINVGACASMSVACCDASICSPNNFCSVDPAVSLQPVTVGGTWTGTGITNTSSGIFDPSIAGAGIHYIKYSLPCGSDSIAIKVYACSTISVCINSGSLTAFGGNGTYSWASTTTSISCASCPGGNCIPFVCAGTIVPTWTASGITINTPSAAVFPIKVTDVNTSTTFTFNTLAAIPTCSVTGINQLIQGNNHATIYPNPNNGEFNIDYAFELGGQEIVLIDILGKEVKYFDLENTKGIKKINISDLSNGVYIYKIQNKNGVLFSGKINLNK